MQDHKHDHRRCLGRNRNFRRCSRKGDWRFFCDDHRRQPLGWVFALVFTVIAGTASIHSAWFAKSPQNGTRIEQHTEGSESPAIAHVDGDVNVKTTSTVSEK